MHEAPGSGQEDTHRPEMEAAAQSAPQAKLSVLEILNMKGGNKRFSIDLILVEAKHCNADGEPVPQEHPFNSQIHQLVLLGQDYEGEQITVEASGDDLSWLKKIAACMRLRQTVTLQNPAFSPSK